MNISGQSLIPVTRASGSISRASAAGDIRRVEGQLIPARDEARQSPSRSTPAAVSPFTSDQGGYAPAGRLLAASGRESFQIEALPRGEEASGGSPALRKAMSTYVENENLTRFDANADFLGRVDAWA